MWTPPHLGTPNQPSMGPDPSPGLQVSCPPQPDPLATLPAVPWATLQASSSRGTSQTVPCLQAQPIPGYLMWTPRPHLITRLQTMNSGSSCVNSEIQADMVICRVPPACLVTTAASWRQRPLRLRPLLLAMGTQPHRCLLRRHHPTAPEPPRPCSSFTSNILPPLLPRPRLRLRRLPGQAQWLRAHRPGYLCRPICIRAHLPCPTCSVSKTASMASRGRLRPTTVRCRYCQRRPSPPVTVPRLLRERPTSGHRHQVPVQRTCPTGTARLALLPPPTLVHSSCRPSITPTPTTILEAAIT